jgi:hypothetical protein
MATAGAATGSLTRSAWPFCCGQPVSKASVRRLGGVEAVEGDGWGPPHAGGDVYGVLAIADHPQAL